MHVRINESREDVLALGIRYDLSVAQIIGCDCADLAVLDIDVGFVHRIACHDCSVLNYMIPFHKSITPF